MRNNLVIFERQLPILDHFIGEAAAWEEVTKAWASIEPVQIFAQRLEFIESEQTSSQRKSVVKIHYTPATAAITTDCRMKLAKLMPINQSHPNDDDNFRIFNIDQIINVGEQNTELQLLVVERT